MDVFWGSMSPTPKTTASPPQKPKTVGKHDQVQHKPQNPKPVTGTNNSKHKTPPEMTSSLPQKASIVGKQDQG